MPMNIASSTRRSARRLLGVAGLSLMAGIAVTGVAQADSGQAGDRKVFGWVEKATIEPWGATVKVKLDSGALTSSMHAENIETYEKDGEDWVRFDVDVEDEDNGDTVEKSFERPLLRDLTVAGAGGRDTRPVVLMTLCIDGERHEDQYSLRDRSSMNYPVLLGRRAIERLGLLDVHESFLTTPECSEDSPLHSYEGE